MLHHFIATLLPLTITRLTNAAVIPGGAPPPPPPPSNSGCGEVNVFLTGLAPYHPLVAAQGFNQTAVDITLRADHERILNAGYNMRYSLFGPEQPLSVLRDELSDVDFDGAGVGGGIRLSTLAELTARFEDIIQVYREELEGPIYFNQNTTTTLEAIQRHFPLEENCEGKPGKDLGFHVICDESVCGKHEE